MRIEVELTNKEIEKLAEYLSLRFAFADIDVITYGDRILARLYQSARPQVQSGPGVPEPELDRRQWQKQFRHCRFKLHDDSGVVFGSTLCGHPEYSGRRCTYRKCPLLHHG